MSEQRLSLCMIVKNEAYFLGRCLEPAAEYADEIIIVDTGSSDDTVEIARRYTDEIYHFAWCDDFAAARNYAIDQASGDWVLVLDADEVVEPRHWRQLKAVIDSTDKDAFFLNEHNYTFDAFEDGWTPVEAKTPYTREFPGYKTHWIARLFRNIPSIRYRGHVHEVIDHSLGEGRFELLDVPIHHHGDENPDRPQAERQREYLRLMEKDLDSDPSGRLYAAAGSIRLHYEQDYATAIAYYDKAIELGWRIEESKENQALATYLAQDFDTAYARYRSLFDAGHRSVNLCINLANLAVKRGESAFAVSLLEEALALGIVDPTTRAQISRNIGFLRRRSERP